MALGNPVLLVEGSTLAGIRIDPSRVHGRHLGTAGELILRVVVEAPPLLG